MQNILKLKEYIIILRSTVWPQPLCMFKLDLMFFFKKKNLHKISLIKDARNQPVLKDQEMSGMDFQECSLTSEDFANWTSSWATKLFIHLIQKTPKLETSLRRAWMSNKIDVDKAEQLPSPTTDWWLFAHPHILKADGDPYLLLIGGEISVQEILQFLGLEYHQTVLQSQLWNYPHDLQHRPRSLHNYSKWK